MSFVGLRPDADCLSDAVRMSTGTFKYHVNPTVIKEPQCPISECNTQFYPGGRQADVLSMFYNSNPTRMYTRGRPSTSLYGTSPMKRMGDGVMYAVDISNNLRNGFGIPLRCIRPEQEIMWDRFDYIDVEPRVENHTRGGISTRFQPIPILPTRAATPVPVQYLT